MSCLSSIDHRLWTICAGELNLFSKPALLLLKEIDEAIEHAATSIRLGELLGTKLSMDTFRADLIHVLMDHGLPTDPVRTMQGWLSFLPLYLSVITDCPVLQRSVHLRHINRLTVRVDREPPKEIPEGALFGFAIHWTFSKDEQVALEWRNEVLYPKDYKPGRFYQLHFVGRTDKLGRKVKDAGLCPS